MIAAGLVEEIAALRRLPHAVSRQAAQAVGYAEICGCLDGRLGLEEAIVLIQMRSRTSPAASDLVPPVAHLPIRRRSVDLRPLGLDNT